MNMRERLAERLAEFSGAPPPCVLGVGNRLRGDDAAGPELCDRLRGRFRGQTIDAGVAPENHLERVVTSGARLVLVADAADFGGAAGEVRLLAPDALAGAGVSTHACSPRMLDEYLAARSAEPPTVLWLVIQPQRTEADDLSPAVAQGLEYLSQGLCELWPAENEA